MPLRFVSAASVSLAEYAAAFTSAFRGYHFPVSFDAGGLARRVRFEQYDLENSLLAYGEGGEVAGVAALAVRGEAGWVAGLAVVPEQRGRGRGRELMSALLTEARACGLRTLSLEVLSHNVAARRLYERAGMRVARDLLILERAAQDDKTEDGRGEGDAASETLPPFLEEAAPAELLAHFARLHAFAPAWQRDLPSLLVKGSLLGLRPAGDARTRSYALVSRESDGSRFFVDLAAAGPEDARRLCDALAELGGPLKIVNEPEHSLFIAPLVERGFVETDRQHEMRLDL